MTRFIKTFFRFVCLFAGLCIGFILFYVVHFRITPDDIPAPNLSDSYSYNEKMAFLQKHNINTSVMSVGSSMSLSNLHAAVLTQRLGTTSYINTASWGTTIKDDFLLLKLLLGLHTPDTKMVLIASNVLDFQNMDKNVKYPLLKDYLAKKETNPYEIQLKTFSLAYYISNVKFAKKVRSFKKDYDYLGYDSYGGVTFDSKDFIIEKERWEEDDLDGKFIGYEYDYLDSISALCNAKNIKLFFIQSPIRDGIKTTLPLEKINNLKTHTAKIESILKKHGYPFINANNETWPDSLFVDATHFNKKGAELFTNYFFDEIESITKQPAANLAINP